MAKINRNDPMKSVTVDTGATPIQDKTAEMGFWVLLALMTTVFPVLSFVISGRDEVFCHQVVGGNSEGGHFYLTMLYLPVQHLMIYAGLTYCQSRNANLIRFLRIGLCPAISIAARYLCGDDYILYKSSILWAASALFGHLAITTPYDVKLTNLLVALVLAFANYGQSLTFNIVIVAFLVYSWFDSMTDNKNAEDPLLSTVMAFFPVKDSILADVETSPRPRAASWEVERVTKEEALERLRNLETHISQVSKKVEEIQAATNTIRTHLSIN